jgi:hypothetical protein
MYINVLSIYLLIYMKPNISEIGKIVKDMTKDVTSAPNYNAAAAEIVKQGIVDKTNARMGYETVLTKPLGRVTLPKPL